MMSVFFTSSSDIITYSANTPCQYEGNIFHLANYPFASQIPSQKSQARYKNFGAERSEASAAS